MKGSGGDGAKARSPRLARQRGGQGRGVTLYHPTELGRQHFPRDGAKDAGHFSPCGTAGPCGHRPARWTGANRGASKWFMPKATTYASGQQAKMIV